MGHVRKLQGTGRNAKRVRYQACWRDPNGRQRTATFATATLARAYLRQNERDALTGAAVEPHGPRTLLRDWVADWLPTQASRAASTQAKVANQLKVHVLPAWGDVPLGSIDTLAVQTWVAKLSQTHAPVTVKGLHTLLSSILAAAVRANLLAANPATLQRGDLPRMRPRSERYLTAEEIAAVADACGARHEGYGALVHVAGWTGLRWGEVSALRWCDVDTAAGELHVRQAAMNVNGHVTYTQPKTAAATRDVVLDQDTVTVLEKQRAGHKGDNGAGSRELVFTTPNGGAIAYGYFRPSIWTPALSTAGLEHVGVHALRHSHAAICIAAGMDVLTLSRRLGHTSAAMTLDRYGHLRRDHVDATRDVLRRARGD